MALKKRGLAHTVRGVGRRQASLDRARAAGAIDEALLDGIAAVRGAELVVLCTPVDGIVEQVLALAPSCSSGTLITDAGSTKGIIVAALEEKMPAGVAFVGSHPLAGSEKHGPEHADAGLFEGRCVVVTRTPRTDASALAKVSRLWQAVGAHVTVMAPADHDRALALTSHLPHLLAASLAGILPEPFYNLTATGFRDSTRIAAGEPTLWRAIFAQNGPAILAALKPFRERLGQFEAALANQDWSAVEALLAQAKKVRDALGN